MTDDLERALEALKAFENWWRLPNDRRTIAAIEEPMRLCLECLEVLREHAVPGPVGRANIWDRGRRPWTLAQWIQWANDNGATLTMNQMLDDWKLSENRRAAPAVSAGATETLARIVFNSDGEEIGRSAARMLMAGLRSDYTKLIAFAADLAGKEP